MPKITPFLWFDNQAEEAANFYVLVFKNSKLGKADRYDDAAAAVPGRAKGSVMTVNFELDGQEFTALNGGPLFQFTEAISFVIHCKSQDEVDHYWDKLTSGGKPSQCGWLKDKFGVSWQVVPTVLFDYLSDKDPAKAKRTMEAMLRMKKLDIEKLRICTAWLFIGPLCLHFSMLYAQVIKSHSSRLYVSLLYVPSFVFLAIYQMHYYEHVFTRVPFWGWVNPHNKNMIDTIQVYWISVLVISAVALLFMHTFRIRNNESLKRQSFLITAGIAIPAIAGVVSEVILPTVFRVAPVPLTSIFMSCFSVATVVALKKYKLFSAHELITSETLINFIPIMVASVSNTGKITYINRAWSEILDSKSKDFIGLHFNDVFRPESEKEAKDLNEAVARVVKRNQVQQTESTIITPKGAIDIISTLTPIKNNNKVEGVLFTSRILAGSKNQTEGRSRPTLVEFR